MENDLISRRAAIEKFEPWLKVNGYSEGELNMLKAVLYELRFLPSAQPDCSDCIKHGGDWDCDHVHCHKGKSAQPERKKGKWKDCGIATFTMPHQIKECSVCGCTIIGGGNFCSECGADMRGEEDE